MSYTSSSCLRSAVCELIIIWGIALLWNLTAGSEEEEVDDQSNWGVMCLFTGWLQLATSQQGQESTVTVRVLHSTVKTNNTYYTPTLLKIWHSESIIGGILLQHGVESRHRTGQNFPSQRNCAALKRTWQRLMTQRCFILKNGCAWTYLLTAAGCSSCPPGKTIAFLAAASETERYRRED